MMGELEQAVGIASEIVVDDETGAGLYMIFEEHCGAGKVWGDEDQ